MLWIPGSALRPRNDDPMVVVKVASAYHLVIPAKAGIQPIVYWQLGMLMPYIPVSVCRPRNDNPVFVIGFFNPFPNRDLFYSIFWTASTAQHFIAPSRSAARSSDSPSMKASGHS